MSARVRDDFKSQEPDSLRSASRNAKDAIRDAASTIRHTASDVADAVQSSASSLRDALPSIRAGPPVIEDTDLLSAHTQSLQDKYDSFDSHSVNISLPFTSDRPGAVASALAAAADLVPGIVPERNRPVLGDCSGSTSDSHTIHTAYYTSAPSAPPQSRYDLTRASGVVPHLLSDIQGVNARVPGAYTTLYTAHKRTQRAIDRTRSSGHVPALASFYRSHHNAVPLSAGIGAGAVSLQLTSPDGPMQVPALTPLAPRDRATISHALSIEANRHAADLEWQPRAVDYVRSLATGAADSILAGLHREEDARMRALEAESTRILDNRRAEVARARGRTEAALNQLRSEERLHEESWSDQLNKAQTRVREAEAEQQRLCTQRQQQQAGVVSDLSQRAAAIEAELKAARAEAARCVSVHEQALRMPQVAVDESGLDQAVSERKQHLAAQLQRLQAQEQALERSVADASTQLRSQRAHQTQAQQQAVARLHYEREALRTAANERLKQLRDALEAAEAQARTQGRERETELQGLRSRVQQHEARVRELAQDATRAERERQERAEQLAADLRALQAERTQTLERAHAAQAATRARGESDARARGEQMVREAEEALLQARRQVDLAVRNASQRVSVPAAELRVCVESEESVAVPHQWTRETLHPAVGVEEHTHRAQMAVPVLETETRHIHLAPYGVEHAAQAGEHKEGGFFQGLFGTRKTEASAV